MPKIVLKPHERIDAALRRFKRACDKAQVVPDYRKHEFHSTNTELRKEALKTAKKKEKKRTDAE